MSANPVTNPGPARILTDEQEVDLVREYYTTRTTVAALAEKWGFKSRRSVYLLLKKISREEALGTHEAA